MATLNAFSSLIVLVMKSECILLILTTRSRIDQMLSEREVIMRLEADQLQPPACYQKVGGGEDEKVSKRWYLVVIGLLYIGLIISFCLNITLLLRSAPGPPDRVEGQPTSTQGQAQLLSTLAVGVRTCQ